MSNDIKKIRTPLTRETLEDLRIGDRVRISGVIYTSRDAAHKRMVEALDRGESLPADLDGQIMYYVGPTPAKPGEVIGSAGPTTSYRMDSYAPRLLEIGLKGMIGKGARGPAVIEAMKKHGAVYFAAIGGAGAVISRSITEAEVIAYDDLGPEAMRRLVVEDFPAIVANDIHGGNLYEVGFKDYRKE